MDTISVGICRRFRQTRIEHDLTQEDYAKALSCNVSYVKAVETYRFVPSFKVIKKWRKKYRIKYDWIIEGG